jgi:hypothetical protein
MSAQEQSTQFDSVSNPSLQNAQGQSIQSDSISNSSPQKVQERITQAVLSHHEDSSSRNLIEFFAFLVFLVLFVAVGILSYFVYQLWKRYSKIKTKPFESSQIVKDNNHSKSYSNITTNYKGLTENDINSLISSLLPNLTEAIKNLHNNEWHKEATTPNTNIQTTDSSVKHVNNQYFASKNRNQLTDPTSNAADAKFKVFNIKDYEADFEYIGGTSNPDWFEGICDIINPPGDNITTKTKITTTHHGIVRQENNNWVVMTPAKIQFE